MTEENTGISPADTPETMTWKERIWEVTKVFILPIAVVLLVRVYVAQPFVVKGASMEPNFEDQEYLIIDEVSPAVRPIERGTVVVFRYPLDTSEFFIKRVIGLPGEHISLKNGYVLVKQADGTTIQLKEPYLARGTMTLGDADIDVPADHYFVLGDNRNFSSDSRRWGLLPKDLITGRALLRLWPPEKMGIIEAPAYSL